MGFFGCSAAGWATADVVARGPAFAGFDEGCVWCSVLADVAARTAVRVAGPELDWAEVLVSGAELDCAEVLVSTAGFDWAGGFVCESALPWGCDGELATGREATEACTFDADTGPAWTPADCRCMYHQPPPASRTLAAIAPIRMPLLELPDSPSSVLCSSSTGTSSPNVGGGNSGTYSSVKLSAAVSSSLGCSARRAVCCLGASVSGAAEGGAGGGGTIAGEADLTSKRESRFETDAVAGTPEVLAGSRMEACASDARGESKSADSGGTGFAGAGFTENCGAADTGATGTTGGGGMVEGGYSGASGSKVADKVEESGATGAAGFCGTGSATFGAVGTDNVAAASFGSASFTTEIGTAGFAARVLGVPLPFAPEAATLGPTGWVIAGEPLAKNELTAAGEGASGCWPPPRRSLGKRMPQKPTTDSVNSSS